MIKKNELYFAKTKEDAIIPTKRLEDAGYDLFLADRTKTIVIQPNNNKMLDSGIATACHSDYFIKLMDKGGMGSKNISVSAGVVDSGYRGSIFISLCNQNRDKYLVLTTQTDEELELATHFDIEQNKFIQTIKSNYDYKFIPIQDCIIKNINKAVTQIVVLPVPIMDVQEISWDELKEFKSERGEGKLGSSGK